MIFVDTGWKEFGIGAEVVATVCENNLSDLKTKPIRLGLPDCPTPSSIHLSKDYYIDLLKIFEAIHKLVNLSHNDYKEARYSILEEMHSRPSDKPDPSFTGPF